MNLNLFSFPEAHFPVLRFWAAHGSETCVRLAQESEVIQGSEQAYETEPETVSIDLEMGPELRTSLLRGNLFCPNPR